MGDSIEDITAKLIEKLVLIAYYIGFHEMVFEEDRVWPHDDITRKKHLEAAGFDEKLSSTFPDGMSDEERKMAEDLISCLQGDKTAPSYKVRKENFKEAIGKSFKEHFEHLAGIVQTAQVHVQDERHKKVVSKFLNWKNRGTFIPFKNKDSVVTLRTHQNGLAVVAAALAAPETLSDDSLPQEPRRRMRRFESSSKKTAKIRTHDQYGERKEREKRARPEYSDSDEEFKDPDMSRKKKSKNDEQTAEKSTAEQNSVDTATHVSHNVFGQPDEVASMPDAVTNLTGSQPDTKEEKEDDVPKVEQQTPETTVRQKVPNNEIFKISSLIASDGLMEKRQELDATSSNGEEHKPEEQHPQEEEPMELDGRPNSPVLPADHDSNIETGTAHNTPVSPTSNGNRRNELAERHEEATNRENASTLFPDVPKLESSREYGFESNPPSNTHTASSTLSPETGDLCMAEAGHGQERLGVKRISHERVLENEAHSNRSPPLAVNTSTQNMLNSNLNTVPLHHTEVSQSTENPSNNETAEADCNSSHPLLESDVSAVTTTHAKTETLVVDQHQKANEHEDVHPTSASVQDLHGLLQVEPPINKVDLSTAEKHVFADLHRATVPIENLHEVLQGINVVPENKQAELSTAQGGGTEEVHSAAAPIGNIQELLRDNEVAPQNQQDELAHNQGNVPADLHPVAAPSEDQKDCLRVNEVVPQNQQDDLGFALGNVPVDLQPAAAQIEDPQDLLRVIEAVPQNQQDNLGFAQENDPADLQPAAAQIEDLQDLLQGNGRVPANIQQEPLQGHQEFPQIEQPVNPDVRPQIEQVGPQGVQAIVPENGHQAPADFQHLVLHWLLQLQQPGGNNFELQNQPVEPNRVQDFAPGNALANYLNVLRLFIDINIQRQLAAPQVNNPAAIGGLQGAPFAQQAAEAELLRLVQQARVQPNNNIGNGPFANYLQQNIPAMAQGLPQVLPQGQPLAHQGVPMVPPEAMAPPGVNVFQQLLPVVPQGIPMAHQGVPYVPPGALLLPQGIPLLPQGIPFMPPAAPLLPQGVPLLPPGAPLLQQGVPLLPPGAPLLLQGAHLLPQGAPLLPQGAPLLPQVDGQNGGGLDVNWRLYQTIMSNHFRQD